MFYTILVVHFMVFFQIRDNADDLWQEEQTTHVLPRIPSKQGY